MYCSNCGSSVPKGGRFCHVCGASIVDGTVPARTAPALSAYHSAPQAMVTMAGQVRRHVPYHVVAVVVLTTVALILLVTAMLSNSWYVISDEEEDPWDDYRWEAMVGFGLWRVQFVEREYWGDEVDWEDSETRDYDEEFFSSEIENIIWVARCTSYVLLVGLAMLILFLILVVVASMGALDPWMRNVRVVIGMVGMTTFIVLLVAVSYFGSQFPQAVTDDVDGMIPGNAGLGASFGIAVMVCIFVMFAAVFSFKGFGAPGPQLSQVPPYAV